MKGIHQTFCLTVDVIQRWEAKIIFNKFQNRGKTVQRVINSSSFSVGGNDKHRFGIEFGFSNRPGESISWPYILWRKREKLSRSSVFTDSLLSFLLLSRTTHHRVAHSGYS